MVYSFLKYLKEQVTREQFELILNMTSDDIKFNRIGFDKTTGPLTFIDICTKCTIVVIREGLIAP